MSGARAVQVAELPPARLQIAVAVLRAVPCEEHASYQLGCPNCLTGEQARALGVSQQIDDLGVVSDSKWRPWSIGRLLARRRTVNANKRSRR
jgi:hypothetical protein